MASPTPAVHAAPAIAPYHPPPSYPPPVTQPTKVTDGRAAAAVVFAVLGLVFSIPLGLPGMIGGTIAYFLGQSAKSRIADSNGTLGGEGAARTGRIVGTIAFALGSVFTLVWLILIFNAMLDTSFAG
jgi:hypothetical protein